MYELIVLSLLMRFPLNRYQLAKIINDGLGPFAHISNGTFYPLFARLEEAGFIEATSQQSREARRERQSSVFQITEAGRQRFVQLMQDTSSFQAEYQRIFLYKAASLDSVSPDIRLFILNHYIIYCQTHVLHFTAEAASLAQELAEVSVEAQAYQKRSLTALHHLVAQWQAEEAWARQLLAEEQHHTPSKLAEEGRA